MTKPTKSGALSPTAHADTKRNEKPEKPTRTVKPAITFFNNFQQVLVQVLIFFTATLSTLNTPPLKLLLLSTLHLSNATSTNHHEQAHPKSNETFHPHQGPGANQHGTGFNQATMVAAYDCDAPAHSEVVFLDPKRCKKGQNTAEKLVLRTLAFIPTPNEHKMSICEVSLSIVGALCGFANLQYSKIMNNADIQLSQETCKKLHSRPWAPVVIDEIPLTTMGADGLYTHTTVTPYRLGENLYTIQIGSVDNEGYCTGGGMTFHGLEYDRERATATLRIKLSKRRLALGE
jgi:hypothetical protein